MTSITDYVKEGLKYPFNDGKKVLTLGVIFLISSLVSFLMSYFIFDSIRLIENNTTLGTVNSVFSAIPQSNMPLIVLSWLISFILLLFASGYLYDIIKYSIEGRKELPEFSDIKGIFLKGIRTFIVGIAYAIVPFLLFILGVMLSANENVGVAVNSIGAIILFISIIVTIFIALVEIMALSNMIAHDELSAAFRFKEILALVKNIGWGKYIGVLIFAFIVVVVLSVFLRFIASMISFGLAALLGSALVLALSSLILNSLFINSYLSVVFGRIFGSIYREAVNGEEKDEGEIDLDE